MSRQRMWPFFSGADGFVRLRQTLSFSEIDATRERWCRAALT
jgi:hypothetical protein